MDSEKKVCQNCKSSFVIEGDDFLFYEKMKVPAPTFCPDCRLQRRLTWRNERTLFKRACALCGKSIISVFSSDKPFPVYCRECYHSDKWDAKSYGMEVDFNKPFLLQFEELKKRTPRQFALVFKSVDSDYTNASGWCKNCYLTFVSDHDEDCAYLYNSHFCKNSYDLTNCNKCEYSNELMSCVGCIRSHHSKDCRDSFNLAFCHDCTGCHDCIGCVNLRNKSYCIFNEQFSKEEYLKKSEQYLNGSHINQENILKGFEEFSLKFSKKYFHGAANTKISGDDISNSKNSFSCYFCKEVEDCKCLINGNKAKDCQDCYVAVENSTLVFDTIGAATANKCVACHLAWTDRECNYTDSCEDSHNLFGCISLKNQEYCILNKQYNKEEYQALVPKIIEHINSMPYVDKKGRIYKYGDFFPAEISPYSYNQTIAQELFPLSKESALEQGYLWTDEEKPSYVATKDRVPDSIADVLDISGEIFPCLHNGKCNHNCPSVFRITKEEFVFYKEMNIPLPQMCPNCRHYQRLLQRNPLKLWHRKCMKPGCENEFETSYAPNRPEIVYCESCYQQEVA